MKKFTFILKGIGSGKSLMRSFMNFYLSLLVLKGKTIDVGGGKGEDYISFVNRAEGTTFETFDLKNGNLVDFEKDKLPADDSTYDTVLFLNVMEHIFNYQHIANEVVRIVKPGGQLIGFVPFLMWYHPDHSDYFRYTHEALNNILASAGAQTIKVQSVAHGPFIASLQMTSQILPRIITVPFFIIAYVLDMMYLKIKPDFKGRYSLGYLFIVSK